MAPGKRPLNNTAPLMIRLPDRDVAVGLPGGRRLVSVNARIAQKIVDFGATSWEAVSGPRMHVQMEEPLIVTRSLDEAIQEGLLEMGHELDLVGRRCGRRALCRISKAGGEGAGGREHVDGWRLMATGIHPVVDPSAGIFLTKNEGVVPRPFADIVLRNCLRHPFRPPEAALHVQPLQQPPDAKKQRRLQSINSSGPEGIP